MTRPYLESVAASNSSMGGLVMPSGTAAAPDKWELLELGDCDQGYQPIARFPDRRVQDHLVELVLSRELDPGRVQPPPQYLGVLGPPPGQPAYQLIPRGRCEEDEQRLRHRRPHLPRALELDLEQHRDVRGEMLFNRRTRRAVAEAGERRVLEQRILRHQ